MNYLKIHLKRYLLHFIWIDFSGHSYSWVMSQTCMTTVTTKATCFSQSPSYLFFSTLSLSFLSFPFCLLSEHNHHPRHCIQMYMSVLVQSHSRAHTHLTEGYQPNVVKSVLLCFPPVSKPSGNCKDYCWHQSRVACREFTTLCIRHG